MTDNLFDGVCLLPEVRQLTKPWHGHGQHVVASRWLLYNNVMADVGASILHARLGV